MIRVPASAADSGVVTHRVGEDDGPLVTDKLVEVDGAVGGLCVEVGRGRPETEAGDG